MYYSSTVNTLSIFMYMWESKQHHLLVNKRTSFSTDPIDVQIDVFHINPINPLPDNGHLVVCVCVCARASPCLYVRREPVGRFSLYILICYVIQMSCLRSVPCTSRVVFFPLCQLRQTCAPSLAYQVGLIRQLFQFQAYCEARRNNPEDIIFF